MHSFQYFVFIIAYNANKTMTIFLVFGIVCCLVAYIYFKLSAFIEIDFLSNLQIFWHLRKLTCPPRQYVHYSVENTSYKKKLQFIQKQNAKKKFVVLAGWRFKKKQPSAFQLPLPIISERRHDCRIWSLKNDESLPYENWPRMCFS